MIKGVFEPNVWGCSDVFSLFPLYHDSSLKSDFGGVLATKLVSPQSQSQKLGYIASCKIARIRCCSMKSLNRILKSRMIRLSETYAHCIF